MEIINKHDATIKTSAFSDKPSHTQELPANIALSHSDLLDCIALHLVQTGVNDLAVARGGYILNKLQNSRGTPDIDLTVLDTLTWRSAAEREWQSE